MTNEELIIKIDNLLEYEDLINELKKEADAIEKAIKECLNERGVEELEVGSHIVRHTSILSTRFDTKRFKTELGEDLYKRYCKEVSSRRFSIV